MKIEIINGIVTNEGAEIGRIEGAKCTLLKNPGPAVFKAINEAHGSKLKFDILPENTRGAPSAGQSAHDAEKAARGAPITNGAGEGASTAGESQAAEPKAPDPEPKCDPMKGRKDPSWIAWKQRQGK
jgi:hypothetical protein